MPSTLEGHLDAKGMRFAILVSRTNDIVCHRLQAGAEDCLERHGAGGDSRTILRVPGSWELPLAARKAAANSTRSSRSAPSFEARPRISTFSWRKSRRGWRRSPWNREFR
jgi:hypothetical protein